MSTEPEATPGPEKIVVSRDKLYPVPGRSTLYAWKWIYEYSIDGAPATQYGTGLGDLRSMLKRRYPTAAVHLEWAPTDRSSPK